ncbi:hypothetical protein CK203_055671 [Vitis vinifera]|uniref:Uncharacterized protein n=1 Tax=Vitis vinifera TaxID=29760 RepID=A0A438FTA5_VITVI|nr:hypothetical protein CK203_055671 [Vitis vinifera]
MDDLPLQKIQISGPTLASMIQRFSTALGDVDGLCSATSPTSLPPPSPTTTRWAPPPIPPPSSLPSPDSSAPEPSTVSTTPPAKSTFSPFAAS